MNKQTETLNTIQTLLNALITGTTHLQVLLKYLHFWQR